jgi:hypothetical protein
MFALTFLGTSASVPSAERHETNASIRRALRREFSWHVRAAGQCITGGTNTSTIAALIEHMTANGTMSLW